MATPQVLRATNNPGEASISLEDVVSGEQKDANSGTKNVLDKFLGTKSTVAFAFNLQASWESAAITLQTSLLNGGPTSMVYGLMLSGVGSTALAASFGELASMDPVVGAQYRWTARLAPSLGPPAFWGLLQGWLTVFAWLAGCTSMPFILARMIQGLIVFNHSAYEPQGWHGSLMTCLLLLIAATWNVYARRLLAASEFIGGVCHVSFFICTVATILALGKHSSAEFVFTRGVHHLSGWTNPGVSWCIGLLGSCFPLTGFDGIIHMTEEVKDAPRRVPRSILVGLVLNCGLQFSFIIAVLFIITDVEKVLKSPTQYAIIEIYYQATGSKVATNILMTMLMLIVLLSSLNIMASSSRLVRAFARDGGLPFPNFFDRINPRLKVPLNSIALVCVVSCLLTVINVFSTTAFHAIVSLTTIALYISYIVPIVLLLLRKFEGRHPQYGPFNLGRWGIPINLFAVVYGVFICVWLPFPSRRPITWQNMNYAGPVMAIVITLALLDWFWKGRKRFMVAERKTVD